MSVAMGSPVAEGVRWQSPHAPSRNTAGVGVASEMADFQDVSNFEFLFFSVIFQSYLCYVSIYLKNDR